ncbi:MAG: pantetheine-phosphate adenylyltransferase [Oscillospiraceae bacterium]|nr:pantetheine-phosphate adenylyltransferase [Oscillospiraceae bacterium]
MKIAVCPGSFDPITNGHLDIIARAAKLFDRVIVCVLRNPAKTGSFSVEERLDLIRRSCAHIENVEVDSFNGLLVDYAHSKGACAIVKGLRAVSDFEYEMQMSMANKKLNENIDTVYLNTASEYMFLSSSVVKQIAMFGGEIEEFVPAAILEDVKAKLGGVS